MSIVLLKGYLTDDTLFDSIRDDLAALLERHGIDGNVYVCHSLGCFIGLQAASREPNAHVIAINMPASPWSGLWHGIATMLDVLRVFFRRGREEAGRYRDALVFLGGPATDERSAALLQAINASSRRQTFPRWNDVVLFWRSVGAQLWPARDYVPRVLALHGSRDPLAPVFADALLRRRMPETLTVTLDGGHVLPRTNPAGVIGAVERFLAQRS